MARTPCASGSLLFGVASSPTKGNHFVFLLRGFAGALWLLDYCIGEDRFLCAALITRIRVWIPEGHYCLDAYSTCLDPAFE
ncbi:hypothetical protein RHGRI_004314 [Rhododendron griersonianum]|uniref:Secreted protein n=1 Tax=Rhododendron griersonianum TaxID=479676 RepID=A0AAV6LA67_9ERIC|nr:hypothetical protein RHGRI_004314 [Rhododendron griersonianum]